MDKILVPYDLSEISDAALDFALQMANKTGACEITVFHVIEHPTASAYEKLMNDTYQPMEIKYFRDLVEKVQSKLNEAVDAHNTDKVTVKKKVMIGNPDREILEEIEEGKMDMVIMGTSGSSGVDEFFVGSNSEKVVRHAKCPVITMQNRSNADTIKEIVFASDFETVNEEFVSRMLRLKDILDARLRIVIINTPASFTSSRLDNKLMDDFVSKHNLTNYTTEIYNHSNEEDGIVAYAEDIGAHMIALGTNQLTGVKHFLKGSIAEDVVNHSPVPVWTYHLQN